MASFIYKNVYINNYYSVAGKYENNGNLKGVGALVKGMKLEDVKNRLQGIKCGFRNTSCPDQLSKAIDEILSKK